MEGRKEGREGDEGRKDGRKGDEGTYNCVPMVIS
jgi:hypothetical protein